MDAKMIIEIASQAAIDKWEKLKHQELQAIQDERLHNTRLLMQNYRLFKKHCEKSIYNLQQAAESESGVDVDDEEKSAAQILNSLSGMDKATFVESIKKSATVTYIIMAHVDRMLGVYKTICEQSDRPEEQRRFRILHSVFLDEHRTKRIDICQKEKIDDSTYYRDLHENFRMLSPLIFGIEGLTPVRKRCK